MSRIDTPFAKLRDAGRTAVIPYIACGDPYADATVDIMLALAAGGADVIELGVPFSDPMADGPVIQRSSERALKHHVGLKDVLAMVREFRTLATGGFAMAPDGSKAGACGSVASASDSTLKPEVSELAMLLAMMSICRWSTICFDSPT